MTFSLKVGRLQAAVKKKKSPTNKDEFLGYLKTEMGLKGELKRWDSFGLLGSDFAPRGMLNNESHLDFSTSYCLSGTELWQDVSSAGYQTRVGDLSLCGTAGISLAAKNLPALKRDPARTAWRLTGTPRKGAQPWVRLSEFGSVMIQSFIYSWVSFGINFISWKRSEWVRKMIWLSGDFYVLRDRWY